MQNLDIRTLVKECGVQYQSIAKELGVTPVWMSRMMSRPLSVNNKIRIAIFSFDIFDTFDISDRNQRNQRYQRYRGRGRREGYDALLRHTCRYVEVGNVLRRIEALEAIQEHEEYT